MSTAADVDGPGAELKSAREAMGISCREVADALNLSIGTVAAIEENRFDELPQAVYTRGYIRAYARLLELDSDAIVARYPGGANDTETVEVEAESGFERIAERPPAQLAAMTGAAVLLILLVAWLWPDGEPDPGREAAEAAAAAPATQRPTGRPTPEPVPLETPATAEPAPATGVAARLPDEASGEVAPAADAAAASAPEAPAGAAPDVPPDAVADAVTDVGTDAFAVGVPPGAVAPGPTPAAAGDGARRISPTGSDRLSLQFTEDCWVEVRSATGANLYSDLNRGGQRLDLIGQAPFRILLGYAPGVALSFNGEAVALAPHTRNNVANLVLGQ